MAFLLLQCKDGPGALYLPETLQQSYSLVFNDTITVKTSTVLLDSIPNSNRGTLLIGKYRDDKLGLVESKPFFQIIYGSTWVLDPAATYDSIELLMNYSGYYYGDTTKSQTIEVRQVVSGLKTSTISKFWTDLGLFSYLDISGNTITNSIYNGSNFAVDQVSKLGTATYIPRPRRSSDTIRVRIDDALGKDLFKMKLANSLLMRNPFQFTDFYKFNGMSFNGLSITSLSNSNIVGVDPQKIKLRIYYRQSSGDNLLRRKHFDFLAVADNLSYPYLLNYNKIITDRSGTPLANLSSKNEISSALTNDESYIQSGVGLVTKLTFPGLLNVGAVPGFKQLTFAQLIVEPVKDSYNGQNYIPSQLILFGSNRTNIPLRLLNSNTPVSQNGNSENGTGYTYTFNITSYIQSVLSADANPKDVVLLLSTPMTLPPSPMPLPTSANYLAATSARDNNIFESVTRACIGNGTRSKYRARIQIYYVKQINN